MKRQVIGLVALVLCTAVVAGAAEPAAAKTSFVAPEQKILGADKVVPLGKLVRLRVSNPEAKAEHLASSAYQWKVYDYDAATGDMVELDDVVDLDGSVFFGAGIQPKKLKAICICTHLFLVKAKVGDKDEVREVATRTVVLSAAVTIGGPDPGPEPEPAFPDGTYKLSKLAYKAAMGVKNEVARTKGAAALAKSYRGSASSFAAGTVADLKAALAVSKTANNQALKDAGIDLSHWDPFGETLADAVFDHYSGDRLKTPKDLAAAWLEVAAGLEKVK